MTQTGTCQLEWKYLEAGFHVVMGDGYQWEVVKHSLDEVTVKKGDRELTRPLPTGEAKVVLTPDVRAKLDNRAANAEKLLQEALGAERVTLGDPFAKVWVEPTRWDHPDQLASHLRWFHGIWIGTNTIATKKPLGEHGVVACHKLAHGDRDPGRPWYVPHIHHESKDTE